MSEALEWKALTDEDRDAAFASMPNMLDGFMKLWGWLHFAKAVEDRVHEKNATLLATRQELLEALQAFMALDPTFSTTCEEGLAELAAQPGRGGDMPRAVQKARAAIAKAQEV